MEDFDSMAEMFYELAKTVKEIDLAIKAHQSSPDAPEEIMKDLGDMSINKLESITPLSGTPEAAQDEAKEKVTTRTNQLSKFIENKIAGILNG